MSLELPPEPADLFAGEKSFHVNGQGWQRVAQAGVSKLTFESVRLQFDAEHGFAPSFLPRLERFIQEKLVRHLW